MDDPNQVDQEPDLLADTSGVVFVEYVVVLMTVTLLGGVTVFSVGLPFYQTFRFIQLLVALPFP